MVALRQTLAECRAEFGRDALIAECMIVSAAIVSLSVAAGALLIMVRPA